MKKVYYGKLDNHENKRPSIHEPAAVYVTGNNSRENKNRNNYYNLMFNKLTKEERETIFAAESIAYFDGLNAALNGVQLNLENILIRNGIKPEED